MAKVQNHKRKLPVRNVGRPTLFTPERRASILADISNRIPYLLVAEANGICEETLYDWLRTGLQDTANNIDSEHAKFSESIKKAERDKIAEHLEKIANNVERWQSDAWILERRWYKHFGANVQLNDINARMDKIEEDEKNARKLHSTKVKKTARTEVTEDAEQDGED